MGRIAAMGRRPRIHTGIHILILKQRRSPGPTSFFAGRGRIGVSNPGEGRGTGPIGCERHSAPRSPRVAPGPQGASASLPPRWLGDSGTLFYRLSVSRPAIG